MNNHGANWGIAFDLVEAMKLMFIQGLINPKGGNGSIRIDDRTVLLTPSGVSKHKLRVEDLVRYDLIDKIFLPGKPGFKPSIEWRTHIAIYEVEANAVSVLHAHPLHVNVLIERGDKDWWRNPIAKYELGDTEICIAKSFEAGSKELSDEVKRLVMNKCSIVIIPQHGVFAWGSDVWSAFDKICALEYLAKYRFLHRFYDKY